jgi:hypothetical protein
MKKLIFLDTETTGNNLLTDHLFEVCYSLGDDIKQEMFKPSLPISVKAQSITHVTNKMVADKPAFAESQMKQDLQILFKDHVLVAHNAKFDIAMLAKEDIQVPEYICTLKVARYLDDHEDGWPARHPAQYRRRCRRVRSRQLARWVLRLRRREWLQYPEFHRRPHRRGCPDRYHQSAPPIEQDPKWTA